VSFHTKHFKAAKGPRADHRSGGPTEIPVPDPKRPGGNAGRRPAGWTRQPTEPGRPGRPGAR
jgi:hypothetical protein